MGRQRFRAGWGLVLALLLGCTPQVRPENTEEAPPTLHETVVEEAAPSPGPPIPEAPPDTPEAVRLEEELDLPLSFPPGNFQHDAILESLRNARSTEFKPVGHTSVVFRMKMDGPHTAAFRPRTRRHRRGHIAEVAAYALGRLLGLDNVAPAIMRRELRRRISERLHPRYDDAGTWEELEEQMFYRSPLETPGAAIYWVPSLTSSDLDSSESRREWGEWLADGVIPEDAELLARDLSNMRVFDYLIGNWDRFSGGNLKLAGEGGRIVLRDHNSAFGRLNSRRESNLRGAVRATWRFSRSFVNRLARLDEAALDAALERFGAHGDNAMNQEEHRALMERVRVVRSHIGARIESAGEDTTLFFD